MFEECEIPNECYSIIMIDKFDPPPIGRSLNEDFDPVVHLEIMDEKEEEEEPEEMNLDDDESGNKVERVQVLNLNRIWLTINP